MPHRLCESPDFTATAPGDYEVIVFAHDPNNGNSGVDRTTFIAVEG